jgi:hypothetical protein
VGLIVLILLVAGVAAFLLFGLGDAGPLAGLLPGGNTGNPLPTPRPGIDVGSGARSVAKDTPEGTWDSYVQDTIAEQVANQEAKITILERYEDPDITVQNLGGLVRDIDLVEDRTEFNVGPADTVANVNAEFEIRITFTNGDTDTRTCRFPASLQFDEEDGVWYIVNPTELAVFVVCG